MGRGGVEEVDEGDGGEDPAPAPGTSRHRDPVKIADDREQGRRLLIVEGDLGQLAVKELQSSPERGTTGQGHAATVLRRPTQRTSRPSVRASDGTGEIGAAGRLTGWWGHTDDRWRTGGCHRRGRLCRRP